MQARDQQPAPQAGAYRLGFRGAAACTGHMRALAAALAVSLATPALAAEDLLGIYRDALRSDPVYRQAIAEREAREEALPQARAGVRPSVNATSSYDYTYQDVDSDAVGGASSIRESRGGSDEYGSFGVGIELRQPLFDWSAVRQVDQAQAQVKQAQADFASARQDLASRVAQRYFAVLDARVALQAAQAQRRAIRRQLEQARQRFEVGVIARTDVEEAQARFDQSNAQVLQAEDDLESARERLRELTGTPLERLFEVREGIDLAKPEPAAESAWRQRAEAQNPRLAAARFAARAAMEAIGVARGGYYPELDAVASYNYEDSGGGQISDSQANTAQVGVELTVPLYQGGGTDSRVRETQYRYTEARQRLEEVRRLVGRDASDAYRGVITALERVRALDQARQSAQAALDAVEAGFEVGTRTIVDVLDAQQQLYTARRDYEQARHAYLVNTLLLQQAAGQLIGPDLVSINALLEPPDEEIPTADGEADQSAEGQ